MGMELDDPRVQAAGKAIVELIKSRPLFENGFGGADEFELGRAALEAAEKVRPSRAERRAQRRAR